MNRFSLVSVALVALVGSAIGLHAAGSIIDPIAPAKAMTGDSAEPKLPGYKSYDFTEADGSGGIRLDQAKVEARRRAMVKQLPSSGTALIVLGDECGFAASAKSRTPAARMATG